MAEQRCPVCCGNGLVPTGFYMVPVGSTFGAYNTAPERCRRCNGLGTITLPTHGGAEPKGDGTTDDTAAIERGGWWPKRGEPYTSPTHDPEVRKVKDA